MRFQYSHHRTPSNDPKQAGWGQRNSRYPDKRCPS
nr:MAG TPA: hypothetical protein [Microviridae sp.]